MMNATRPIASMIQHQVDEFRSLNVAAHLANLARLEPDRPAIHFPKGPVSLEGFSEHATLTFAELNADADALAHGLATSGIARGSRVAMMVPPSADFFALTFALLKLAAVPILIDPGMGIRNLGKCLAEAGPEAFIGIPKAHLARSLLGWGRRTLRIRVTTSRRSALSDTTLERIRNVGRTLGKYAIPDVTSDEMAAILFTSGSTGVAKGVVYTHGTFSAQVESLKQIYGIEPGEIDLCTFPLFALFGPALGMTCVIPDMNPSRPASIDPRKAVAQIRQFGVTNLFGSPAVIRALAEWGRDRGETLPTLRRAISAGAPAAIPVIETFAKLLPDGAEVFTPYGATEALPVANIGSGEILAETRYLTETGKGVCVGLPAPGITVRVIPISDDASADWDEEMCLPSGEIGEFVVRGPVVTRSYFHRPEATRLAKITDRRTGDLWHRMGDVGYLDERGRLWFCGRKSHRVITPWGTLFTDRVEPIFNSLDGVFRTALVGVACKKTIYPVLCVELSSLPNVNSRYGRESWESKSLQLLERASQFEHTRAIATFLRHPGFPVDIRHNSKIFREKLAVWASKKLGKRWAPSNRVTISQPRAST